VLVGLGPTLLETVTNEKKEGGYLILCVQYKYLFFLALCDTCSLILILPLINYIYLLIIN
jgi:hypothetical protein